MDVSGDGDIQLVNITRSQVHAGLLLNPGLELRISRMQLCDEFSDRLGVQAEGAQHHGVVPIRQGRITRGVLVAGLQRGFEPQARQVEDTQRTGNAGADEGNVGSAHK